MQLIAKENPSNKLGDLISPRISISTWAGSLFIGIFAFIVSANTLLNGFVFDDFQNILHNAWIRNPGRVGEAFTHHMAAFNPSYETSYYRPLMHVIYAGCYLIFALKPWGFHLINLLLHAAICAIVYTILVRWSVSTNSGPAEGTFTSPSLPTWSRLLTSGPVIGGLIFASHPIHTEVVAWNAGIVETSFTLFLLLAFLVTTERSVSRVVQFTVPPAFFFLSLLSKEPGLMLLPVLLIAFLVRGDFNSAKQRRDLSWILAGFAIAGLAYLLLRVNALGGLMGVGGGQRVRIGALESVATAVALFGKYIKLAVLPFHLSAVHNSGVVTTVFDSDFLFGVVAMTLFAVLSWLIRQNRGACLGAAFFLFPLLPALYVPVLGEGLSAERYLYLSSIGEVLLLAVAMETRPLQSKRWAMLRAAIAGGVLIVFLLATVERNAVWRTDLSLWTDAVQKVPQSAVAHQYLGYALLTSGKTESAIASFTRSLHLDPKRTDTRVNLASALSVLGRNEEAIVQAKWVLRERPRDAAALVVLGYALANQGLIETAIAAYEQALTINPLLAEAHNLLGVAFARLGQRETAMVHFREATRIDPENPDFARNLALISR